MGQRKRLAGLKILETRVLLKFGFCRIKINSYVIDIREAEYDISFFTQILQDPQNGVLEGTFM